MENTENTQQDILSQMASMRPSKVAEHFDQLDTAMETFRTQTAIEGLIPGDIIQRRSFPQSLRVLLNAEHVREALADYDAMLEMGMDPEGAFIAFGPAGNESQQTDTFGRSVFAVFAADNSYLYRPDAEIGFRANI